MIEPVGIENREEYSSQPARRSPDQFKFLKLQLDSGVARLTLNRPEHNLLNEAMLREMEQAFTYCGERSEVKLIVLDLRGQRPSDRRRCGVSGLRGHRCGHAQSTIRTAGNQHRCFSATRFHNSSVLGGPQNSPRAAAHW